MVAYSHDRCLHGDASAGEGGQTVSCASQILRSSASATSATARRTGRGCDDEHQKQEGAEHTGRENQREDPVGRSVRSGQPYPESIVGLPVFRCVRHGPRVYR